MSDGAVAFAYHLLYPHTVGGAERYYAALAAEVARRRHAVHLTRSYGPPAAGARPDGVEVVALGKVRPDDRGLLARSLPKLEFALRLCLHLLRHGGRYDAVHVCCFPHVAVLGAAAGLLPHRRTLLVVDWHEVLPRGTWRARLGRAGDLGWTIQRLAIRCGDAAVAFSRLHARRLREEGRRDGIEMLPEFPPERELPEQAATGRERERVVLFAGRLVPEKRAHLLAEVVDELGDGWRGVVFGDGPERERVERAAANRPVELRGFTAWPALSAEMLRATALVIPTVREGFGLVVLEAAAHGLPAVLVDEPDNAAVELIEDGRNGVVCESADPRALAAAVRRLAADPGVHRSARAWFDERREHHSVETAAREVEALHARLRGAV